MLQSLTMKAASFTQKINHLQKLNPPLVHFGHSLLLSIQLKNKIKTFALKVLFLDQQVKSSFVNCYKCRLSKDPTEFKMSLNDLSEILR